MTATLVIVAFSVCAFVAIAGALGMTTTMSMFRSGIFLMASFVGVAGLFILLAADLIGVLQIMMYIGGFLVMILFMVLVMHDPGGSMMAGMDMALVERWFSKGLAPRELQPNNDAGHAHPQDHDPRQDGHQQRDQVGAPHREARGHLEHDRLEGGHSHRGHRQIGDAEHGRGESRVMEHSDARTAGKEMAGKEAVDKGMGGKNMSDMDMSMVTPVRPVAVWLAGTVGVLLVGMLLLRPTWRVVDAIPDPDSARRVGQLLMEKYMVAFEGAGFLILIGIFGAVLLARPSTYPDDASRSARVAVDEKPEPINDEGLKSIDERIAASAHHQTSHHPGEHRE